MKACETSCARLGRRGVPVVMLVSFAVSMLAGGSVVKATHGFAKPPRALSFRASVTTTEQNLTPLHRAGYNGHPAVQRTPAQNMCAECDLLIEQLRIVRGKSRAFDEGLRLLQRTRQDMQTNTSIADGLAVAYVTLQGVNIAFGLATLPCSISQQWLRGLIGGAAGLGAYVQEGNASEVTLATVVSSLGLGVVSDAISTYEFMQQYRTESTGLDALRHDLDRTVREFQAARETLRRERRRLESDLSRGGCSFDPLDEFLRP